MNKNNNKIIYIYNKEFYLENYIYYEKMNMWPIGIINNKKYFYTNEKIIKENSNEVIIPLYNQYYFIQRIEENLLNDILYKSMILNVTNVHINNKKIIYKDKKTIDCQPIEEMAFKKIYNYIKIHCNFKLLSNEDESGVLYINFLGNIIGVRVSIFIGLKDFYLESDNILISLRFLKDIENNFYSAIINNNLCWFMQAITTPGLIVIGGETGRGKTTFLYNLLDILSKKHLHIITIEDPVEKIIENIFQREIENHLKNNKNNYEEILKSILRHNPDVIVIGEIRDEQLTKLCVRSILTGHSIICTIHLSRWANNKSTEKEIILNNFLKRFEDLNIKSSYISNYLKGFVFLDRDYKVKIFDYNKN
jgi:type II secretory ATPase GspE/PulE/Tfp pilus assembly ATPase PilB-like protein